MHYKIIWPDSLKIRTSYESDVPWGGDWGDCIHVPVPEGIDPECVRAISWQETVVVEDIPARAHYDEVSGEWVEDAPAVTHEEEVTRYGLELDPALAAAKAEHAKQVLVSEAHGRMDQDVYAEMERVYGTKKSDSATAFYLSWQDMLAAPEAYVSAVFPSTGAVTTYATTKLQLAREYSVWRLGRIAQFEAERAAILSSN